MQQCYWTLIGHLAECVHVECKTITRQCTVFIKRKEKLWTKCMKSFQSYFFMCHSYIYISICWDLYKLHHYKSLHDMSTVRSGYKFYYFNAWRRIKTNSSLQFYEFRLNSLSNVILNEWTEPTCTFLVYVRKTFFHCIKKKWVYLLELCIEALSWSLLKKILCFGCIFDLVKTCVLIMLGNKWNKRDSNQN